MNKDLTYQAYYTKSDPILNYMTRILDITPHDSILEPCGGDGVFVDKILESNPSARIDVFELDPNSVSTLKVKYLRNPNISIKLTDTLLDVNITNRNKLYDPQIRNL